MVEDWDGGIAGLEACRGGGEGLGLRVRVGLTDERNLSGEEGAVDFVLVGSSTTYIGVSKSRNSKCHR